MKKTNASLFFHPVFIISLLVLLLNDFFWKYEYSNWLTGKLSDVAGLVVLPIFCRVVFPKLSNWIVAIVCVSFFVYWKSILSQPLIDVVNHYLHIPVTRVVDYSDLFAIGVMPVALKIQAI